MMRERSAALESRCLTFVRQPVIKAYLAAPEGQARGATVRPDAATIADSLGEYLKELQVSAAVITDRDGRSLGESGTARPAGSDRSHERGVSEALRGGDYSVVQ